MCLIVDNNRVHLIFRPEPDEEFLPIVKALKERRAKAVYGGELVNEYKTLAKYFRIILEFDRQGMMRRVPDEKVNEAQAIIEKTVDYKSDDPHILALAQVSKVRLLLTDDDDLTTDFTNKDVISPKGNVYKNKAHAPLIRKHCEC